MSVSTWKSSYGQSDASLDKHTMDGVLKAIITTSDIRLLLSYTASSLLPMMLRYSVQPGEAKYSIYIYEQEILYCKVNNEPVCLEEEKSMQVLQVRRLKAKTQYLALVEDRLEERKGV